MGIVYVLREKASKKPKANEKKLLLVVFGFDLLAIPN